MLFLLELFALLFILISAVAANTGGATFYTPGMGSCGIRNSGSDLIAAVSAELYDTFPGATPNPNLNPVCKKTLTAHYQGKSVTVMVTDRCPGCKGKFDLDLSPAAFNMLADPSFGRLTGVEWSFDGEHRKRSIHETHRMARRKRGEVKL